MDAKATAERYVGIDVSKARVDVHVRPGGTAFGAATDAEGLAALVARLKPVRPTLVVLEASGGYEGVVAAALAEAGLPVAIVNPRQVRKFAGAIGRLAKTDAIDAAVIAHFAEAVRPQPRPLPDELASRLQELMARRRQLVVMINAEKQRLAKAHDPVAQRSFRALLKSLEAERARIDKAIDKLIEASPVWCAKQDLLKSVPGIGDVVARTLIAELPELGQVDRHQNRRPGRRCPDEPRQRPISWQAQDPGWPGRSPGAALHGLSGRHPAQPSAGPLLPPSARGRQTGPPRPRRRNAQIAYHPQCDPARWHHLGTRPRLSVEAVAASTAATGGGSRPIAAAGGGAIAPALNRRSTRPKLQPSLRPP